MPERTVNPLDNVDLAILLQALGGTLGTLYVQAHVYDPSNVEITGSPFTLSAVANDMYALNNAFQATSIGSYKVIYLIYTDAGFTTRSNEHGEMLDIINVKIQSSSGLGGGQRGGDVIVDFDIVKKWLNELEKKFNKKIGKLQKDFDAGLKVDVPGQDLSQVEKMVSELKIFIQSINFGDVKQIIKKENKDIFTAIKKNRSTIIKSRFDRAMLKPMLEVVADSNLRITKGFQELKTGMTSTIDMKNEEANKMFNETINKNNSKIERALNQLDESIRKKLKFTLEGLKSLLFAGRQPKQNINITMKKYE